MAPLSPETYQRRVYILEGTSNLLKHETEHYKKLFGSAPGNLFQMSSSLWDTNEILNVGDNLDLTQRF